MDITRKPYEISLWEDVLTIKYEDDSETEGTIENGHGPVVAQYYKERKICIIGSDTMNTPIRAVQGKLVSKINGENTLTFNMYSHYFDEVSGEFYSNPFIGLLFNERKVKLRYGALGAEGTKWYDFVIKNVQENSETKTYTYTAKDLFVNELSKSGFNLVLDAELENNMGTIEKLAKVVLDESDWQFEDSDTLREFIEEPLYQLKLNEQLEVTDIMSSETNITIPEGSLVYGFYSDIVNRQPYLQLLYAETYEVNDDFVITNSKNWYINNATYNDDGLPTFASAMGISDKYRGKRLIRKATTKYDSTIDKYVSVYKQNDGKEIYGYTETEYTSPVAVRSLITNGTDYESTNGWEVGCGEEGNFPVLEATTVPHILDADNSATIKPYLKFEVNEAGQKLYNSGIIDNRSFIEGFALGSKYVFRIKYGTQGSEGDHGAKTVVSTDIDLNVSVARYTLSNGSYTLEEKYFDGVVISSATDNYGYKTVILSCELGLSYSDMIKMTNSLGLFIEPAEVGTIYIEDVQFFPYIEINGEKLLPGGTSQGEVRTLYLYYYPSTEYKSIEDVNYIYKDYEPAAFAEVYDTNFEKVRSINASESNRFNIIQELCEIFECWAKFRIEHNEQTGEIALDENHQQKKYVSFHEYKRSPLNEGLGKDNYAGFKYGINLKQIQRTIDSDTIVSKLVVKNNSNEFATDGFCSIARAAESPNGENFILDFSYYIHQGLLSMTEITNDLYLETNGYIGYYKFLKQFNNERDLYIQEQSGLLKDITEYTAQYQTYSISVSEAEEKLRDNLLYFKNLTGYTFEYMMDNKGNDWWKNEEVIKTASSIGRLETLIKNQGDLRKAAEDNLGYAQSRYDTLDNLLTSKTDENSLLFKKEALNKKFYKKYSRFLQEGSWISEDYVDDNLYYLDAQSTLHTSSQPKVSYNINVLEISQVEGYENYNFALGDKTTIEDVEFFGWVMKEEGVRTPYKEEIVVTELTIMLDSPDQNQIKVQNYKTQFEDLFQRMAATTQSVEYSTGKYQKVTNIINEDGTITMDALQNSVAGNAIILQNAKDQSVIWDETGITTISLSNPSEMLRIVSGGLFVSIDGGLNWYTGITGKGINANLIYGGQIDTQVVNIKDGSFPSFRWDSSGISAYEYKFSETGEPTNFNDSKFVRLDQYGLYGINGYSNFNSAEADDAGVVGEEKIQKYSNFSLTWEGFQIKSNAVKGGYVSITSKNDFQVFSAPEKEQIKIGLLYDEVEVTSRIDGKIKKVPLYGIRIKDWEGYPVMEQSSDGKMWIRDELKVGMGTSSVSIGYLGTTKADTAKIEGISYSGENLSEIHQVINAANKFIVHEDGSMVATDGQFTGTIYATGGKIGNMEITDIGTPEYEIDIESSAGSVFKNLDSLQDDEIVTILTATLYYGVTPVKNDDLIYKWYNSNNSNIVLGDEKSLEVTKSMLDEDDFTKFVCEIIQGEDTKKVSLLSSEGQILKDYNGLILTAWT